MTTDYDGPHTLANGSRLDRMARATRPLLACYFPMGDPLFDDGIRDIYADCGVDILELGIPTANPYLDGPDVAGAMARALSGAIDPYRRMADIASWLAADPDRPAGICMAYDDLELNRIADATLDTLDGFLILNRDQRPDREALATTAEHHAIRACGLVPLDGVDTHLDWALTLDGYVMMQAAAGTTGPREALDPRLGSAIAVLRETGIVAPILAGFGIGTARQAREALDLGADGVVIGSMCVRKVVEGGNALAPFLRDVRAALDA